MDMKGKYTNNDEDSLQKASNKKLDEIIKQSKLENEALKKLLTGLEKLENESEKKKRGKPIKKKQK